jgi:hypothetical protein
MNDDILIKQADIQKIAEEGAKIYQTIKADYEPKENGKFLAIDIESKKAYPANTSAEALELARQHHPQKVFYVVKIGFNFAEMLAKSFASSYT